MIKFNLEPVEMWVPGDAKVFDKTELGKYSKEERSKIQFLIRSLTDEEDQELKEQAKRKKVTIDFNQYKGLDNVDKVWFLRTLSQMEDPVDIEKYVMARICASLSSWKGFVDSKEKEMPCDGTHKRLVFNRWPSVGNILNALITELTTDLDGLKKKLVEDLEKN